MAANDQPGDDSLRRRRPPRSTAALPSALVCLPEILEQLHGRRPALFLDYDGTLTPIVARPEQARLAPETRTALEAAVALGAPVAVVSGRDLDDIRRLVNLPGLVYVGSHGFDIAGPGGLYLRHPGALALLPELDAAEAALVARLAGVPGVQLERKRFSLAVHYRRVPAPQAALVAAAVAVEAAARPRLRRTAGKMVFELRPALDWHKGRAVEWLLEALGREGPAVLPLYLGDDLTDEDAFRALQMRGLGVVVREGRPRSTFARYALESPLEVRRFLQALGDHLAGPTGRL